MNRNLFRTALALSVAGVAISSVANGQVLSRGNVANWTNSRGDDQHSGWQRLESPAGGISVADVKGAKSNYSSPDQQPGFGLQIKHKMDNTSANLASLSAGVTLSAAGLGTNMGFFGASGNRTIGVDMDTGQAWFTHVYEDPAPAGTIDCPGATVAAPARPSNAALLAPPTGTPAAAPAAVNQPYGTYTSAPGAGLPKQRPAQAGPTALGDAAAGAGRAGAPPAGGAPGAAGAGRAGAPPAAAAAPAARAPVVYGVAGALQRGTGAGAAAPTTGNTYTVSNDGKIHTLTDWYGLDVYAPAPFIPAGAQPTDLIAVDDVVYASTINSCHGTANGVYGVTVTSALPRGQGSAAVAGGGFGGAAAPAAAAPATPARPLGQVTSWLTGGTSSPSALSFIGAQPPMPAGPAAPSFLGAPTPVAIGPAATTAIVATTAGTGQYANSIVALNVPSLTVKSAFTQPGADFITAPTLFLSGDRMIGAVQSRDGRIFLVDTADLSKPLLVTTPVAGLGGYKPAGLASWQDPSGQRWLLSTTATSVIGYKVSVNGATATLTQGWVLSGLKAPLAPVIVNGVVFAASSGEDMPASASASVAARVKASTPAVLYALDGVTGEKLWNSGKTITSFIPHTSGLWVSMGQVGLADYNNNFYTFGTTMERPTGLMRD